MMKNAFMLSVACGVGVPLAAHAAVLYDASANALPEAAGWQFVSSGNTLRTEVAGGMRTDTTQGGFANRAGYFSHLPVFGGIGPFTAGNPSGVMDAGAGYTLTFDVQINAEAGNAARDDNSDGLRDRAGFSVVAISADATKSVEIAFTETNVFIYDYADLGGSTPEFVQAPIGPENAAFDTTAAIMRYELQVIADSYTLIADGQTLLTGLLRDYTAEPALQVTLQTGIGPINASYDVYNEAGFIFIGDNTTSAESDFTLSYVELSDIPAPGSLVMFAAAGVMAGRRRR